LKINALDIIYNLLKTDMNVAEAMQFGLLGNLFMLLKDFDNEVKLKAAMVRIFKCPITPEITSKRMRYNHTDTHRCLMIPILRELCLNQLE